MVLYIEHFIVALVNVWTGFHCRTIQDTVCVSVVYLSVCPEPPTVTDQEGQEVEKGKDKKKKKKDRNRTKTKDEKVESRGKPGEEEHKVRKTSPVTGIKTPAVHHLNTEAV